MKNFTKGLAFLVLVVVSCMPVAVAQIVTATLVGRVTDQSGAAVADAKITVVDVATGLERSVVSGVSGDYSIPLLPIGAYQLTAEKAGFGKAVVSGITLEVEQTPRVDVALTVGTRTESVEVTTATQLMQTDTSDIGTVVDNSEMEDIPLDGRKLLDLNLLDAGAARLSNFRNDPAGAKSQDLGGAGMSFNGTSVDGNVYMVDGLQDEGMQTTHMTYQPTLESIQEFKQESNQYDATSGFGGGAQINVVTKSGTNSFHGIAYDYLQNDLLDADNFFAPEREENTQNQFGGVLGGPIIKDNTFFFFSYEGTRIREDLTALYSVPSEIERTGDFSGAGTIYDPSTTAADPANPGQYTRTPFPGNIIPANEISPIAAKALNLLWPAPNLPGDFNNLLASPERIENSNQYMVRVDHRFNNSQTLFGRYTRYTNQKLLNSFSALPDNFDIVNNPASSLAVGYVWVISPRMVNELRAGWSSWHQVLEPADGRAGTKIDWHALLGLAAPPNGVAAIQLGKPTLSIAGYGSTGGQVGSPNDRNDGNYQVVDNLSFTKGNHQMSIGGAGHFWRETQAGINLFVRGDYQAAALYTANPEVAGTGNALADFLLGDLSGTLGGDGFASNPYSRNLYGTYFQDNWNVSSKLTLNLGVRYEYFGPWSDPNNNLTFFSFPTAQFVSTHEIEEQGLPSSSYTVSKHNFAPRVGLAWRPFGNTKTVVRTGFGMFYLPHQNLFELLGLNPNPTSGYVSWIPNPIFPNLTLADPFPTALGTLGTPSGYAMQPHWNTPYNMQWSLFVQQELAKDLSLEVGYVGTRGVHLEQGPDINAALPGPGTIESRQLYPGIGSLNVSESLGESWYNGLEVNLERKWQSGFSFKASYTYSKALSDTDLGAFAFQGGLGNTQGSPFDLRAQKGRDEFDARHRFALSYIYALPFGRGKRFGSDQSKVVDAFFGGWQINGITLIQSGTPVNTSLAFDNTNTGQGGADDRPDMVSNPNNGPKTTQEWFNTAAFVTPVPGTYGNAPRNVIDDPGIFNFDFSLFKNFRIGERQQLQFRAEAFNLFNTPQFDPPDTLFGTAGFGTISSSGDGRHIQLALKYSF
jgi:hypothetical protein